MTPSKQDFLINLIAAIILYVTVIIYQGYQYGQSDQSQILPVLYEKDHPGTYTNDHYVNAYLAAGVNERTIFHALFRHMGYDQPWLVFIWHALSGIALILAWISIAGMFIKNKGLQWLCIGLILTIGFHTSTGSNEMYYNQFIPSLPAKALASWGLYYWLNNKFKWWTLLLIAAGYLQPLVGFQLFLLTTIALLIELVKNRSLKTFPWIQILFYTIATLPWLYLLIINNAGHADPKDFMDIMEFRLSHHFFGSYFGMIHLMLAFLFTMISIAFYDKRLKWFFILVAISCLFYELGVEVLGSPFILYSQWWKTTIWVEAFGFIAIVSYLERQFSLPEKMKRVRLLLPFLLLFSVSIYRLSGWFGEKPEYMDPLSAHKSDEVDISEQALQLTSKNSVFIIPPELSAFRWYSKRSSFVDYKAMIHNEYFLKEWYKRIDHVYKYNLATKSSGISLSDQSRKILNDPSPDLITKWKALGVTHIISYSSELSALPLLGKNGSYTIYSLL